MKHANELSTIQIVTFGALIKVAGLAINGVGNRCVHVSAGPRCINDHLSEVLFIPFTYIVKTSMEFVFYFSLYVH